MVEGGLTRPADVPRERIEKALTKHNGVIRRAAKALGLNRESLRLRIEREPELVEFRRNQLIDRAEERVADLTDADSDAVQLRAASFILTHLGADRGWRKSKEIRLPISDLQVINETFGALINEFVPPGKQDAARSFVREKFRESFQKPGAGFQRTA